jgi:hypothetical protein
MFEETVIEPFALTVNFRSVPDNALVELIGDENMTVPELVPAADVAVVI